MPILGIPNHCRTAYVWGRLRHLLLPACLCIAGCASSGLPPAKVEVPTIATVAAADLSAFDQAAIGAVQMRLRGTAAAAVENNLLVGGSERIEPEAGFRYDGFLLRQVTFIEQTTGPSGDRTLRAVLSFEDFSERRAAAEAVVTYRSTSSGIEFTHAAARPVYRTTPRTAMYVVPADLLLKAGPAAAASYGALYRFARVNGVDMSGAGAVPEGNAEYVILVLTQDRLAPEATVRIRLDDNRRSSKGISGGARYVAYDGDWLVAMAPGEFSLRGRSFWIKAIMKSGAASGETAERVVGLFKSQPVR